MDLRIGGISPLTLDLGMNHLQWTLPLRWIFSCVLCRLHIIYHVVNLSKNKQLEMELSENLSPYKESWFWRAGYCFNGDFAIRNVLFVSTGNKVANLAFQFSVHSLQVLRPKPRDVASVYQGPELNNHPAVFSFHFLRRVPLRCFLRGEEILTKFSRNLFVCGPKNLWGRTILCNSLSLIREANIASSLIHGLFDTLV